MENYIKIRGARQHNLKNVDLDIPKNKLIVFTGVSGSGKSSLAFDTIYAEGQRRYVESLSTYARQFLGIMEKPDVDLIEGLSPAISIDQKTTSKNPRSTVGTVTEIYDYMRLLYARVGHPHCPVCQREISSQSVDQIKDAVLKLLTEIARANKTARIIILAPMVKDKKGEYSTLFDNLKAKGTRQVRVDKHIKNLFEDFVLIKTNKHSIEAVVDKISVNIANLRDEQFINTLKPRLTDAIEQSLKLSDGLVIISQIKDPGFVMPDNPKEFTDHLFSEKFACPIDNIQIDELEPRTFSFNSPHGACPTCSGLGKILKVDSDLVFSPELSILEGAILPFSTMFEHDTWYSRLILEVCRVNGIDPKIELKKLSEKDKNLILFGTPDSEYKVHGTNRFGKETYIYETFEGIVGELEKRHKNTESDYVRSEIEKYMRETICPDCQGTRLKKEALNVTIDKKSISDVSELSIDSAIKWVGGLSGEGSIFTQREMLIAKLILKEIQNRLGFLKSVGLEYLTLNRSAGSLSGGEAQRIRLASQIGSGLTGVLYVLDEPTIGLHQKDNAKLIETLKRLRDLGNSVIVVEHDEIVMRESDLIVDFGPGAGKFGGEVTAIGTVSQLENNPKSLTGKYLSGKKKIEIKNLPTSDSRLPISERSEAKDKHIKIYGCRQFNLKNIDVEFPLGKLVAVTGVSGSGKSSLLVDTLYPALQQSLNPNFRGEAGLFSKIEGLDSVDKVILIDQSPIGRTPRSNPATYTKVFDLIRDIYAQTRDARTLGFDKGRFSFNVKGGRCEACEGQGQIKIEMQFMSDIWVTCDVCQGKRYNNQTLEVNYKGKNIADVLSLTISEAKDFFQIYPQVSSKLSTLEEVGLGYMELGQPATTLSGGEAQRVKLSTELSKRDTGRTVYILDEPTTGLHFADLEKLLSVLKVLVLRGNSVFLIEHNMDVIKNADFIIDLGPGGGDSGGTVIAKGTPGNVAADKNSATGEYLKMVL